MGRLPTRRLLAFSVAAVAALAFAGAASAQRYVVLYEDEAPAALADSQVTRAGGSVVAVYSRIGVVVAESDDPGFEPAIESFRRVKGAAATAQYASTADAAPADAELFEHEPANGPVQDNDTFSDRQWALDQIHAKEAHAITGGSRRVLVGHIDTGVDATHPDLAPNLDARRSVSCVGGAANRDPVAWNDDSGHGTHTAGVIAAASNGIGVVGVAPNVRFAAIKASLRDGTRDVFLPEAVVCAFVWAANHGVDVANNSYSVDSTIVGGTTEFCRDDPDQRIVIKAVQRAVRFAQHRGVTVIASAGNSNQDVTTRACERLPSSLPGVVTVAGTGPSGQRSSFSNFGLGYVDVAAPAGEVPPFAFPPDSFILSSSPGSPAFFNPATTLCDPVVTPCPVPGTSPGTSYYRFMAGTSQAAAHASGVAALIAGRFVHEDPGLHRAKLVAAILLRTADPVPCPQDDPRCVSAGAKNGFYGQGLVNALRAVTFSRH